MIASVIIPTYNRSQSLKAALESIAASDMPHDSYEIVVVDNDSNDDTPAVAEAFRRSGVNLTYVKEKRLSFTVARHTGAAAAKTDILCYVDDDVVVTAGWLRAIVDIFRGDEKVGMVAGRILPTFEQTPPSWATLIQKRFNGWSLWDLGEAVCESPGACGPSLAVRKRVLDEVGGFPPDTIGGESQMKPGTVEKIYIGPGDWGLGEKVKASGYRIVYSPAALYHVIPPVRMTKAWWRSRFVGEAYMRAFTDQVWHRRSAGGLRMKAVYSATLGAGGCLAAKVMGLIGRESTSLYEFGGAYMTTRANVEWALARDPRLAERLWEIGLRGIQPSELDALVAKIP